jgi:hypothetical protein
MKYVAQLASMLGLIVGIAQAANVTVADPSCAAFTASASGHDVTVTCASVPPEPIPPDPPTSCTLQPLGHVVTWPQDVWSSTGFNNSNYVALKVVVAANAAQYIKLSFAESGGGPVSRTVTLSSKPCDWTNYIQKYQGSGGQLTTGVNTTPGVVPGSTYYYNIRNTEADGSWSCHSGNCDVVTNFVGK